MTAVGIVAEYNPFHNGHLYHLTETAARFPGKPIVCVMSGNVVQRGSFAMFSKHARAASAVLCGADLVLELPAAFVCAPAPVFAERAVEMMAATGIVDGISFGSECGDESTLLRAAQDSTFDRSAFERALHDGKTYAAARCEALPPEVRRLLSNPNDLLAVEYIRAVHRFLPDAAICAVRRCGAAHHETDCSVQMPSASALRARLHQGKPIQAWLPPPSAAQLEQEQTAGRAPVFDETPEQPMLAVLRRMTPAMFTELPEVSEGLEYRIASAAQEAVSLLDLFGRLKTKRYTLARLRRIVLSAYLGLTRQEQMQYPAYLRVLAASERGIRLLHDMKQTAKLPVITKPAVLKKLNGAAGLLTALEQRTDSLYALNYPAQGERSADSFYRISPFLANKESIQSEIIRPKETE